MSEEWKDGALNTSSLRHDNWLVRMLSDGIFGIFRKGRALTDDNGDPKTFDSLPAAKDHVDQNYPS